MDQFHHVSTAFLELKSSYQEILEEAMMKLGEGMAKFICKEIETIGEYDEYCNHVNGSLLLAASKIFHASGSESFIPGSHWYSMGCFHQKANVIEDYLEDINEKPKPRMFWPREIWSKYVKSLEEFKYEENSDVAVQCLNEMVTNALVHVEDCLKYMSGLSNPRLFRFLAIPQIMAMGTLALCYGNIEVFRGKVKLRRGLTAKIVDQTKAMADVYGAFCDFSSMLKAKVDMNDPNATITMSRIEAVQKICRDSGTLDKRKSYTVKSKSNYIPSLRGKEKKMLNLGEILIHPDELYPLFKLRMAEKAGKSLIPREPHWGFCHSILPKVSQSFPLIIQQLDPELRDVGTIYYLVLRALDTVEDDTSVATDVKVPILEDFHRHIYDPDWHFSCGVDRYKILMDEFHHVSTAFLELESSYRKIIKEIIMRMGAGMTKFICQKIETIDDYNEYCQYVGGHFTIGCSKLFHASGSEVLFPDCLSSSLGLFAQKTNIIQDYLEDTNEIPKPRIFWPPQIWRKYVNEIEDLKSEQNLDEAVQCLNEMVTDALIHVEDCLRYMSGLRNPHVFRFFAIPQLVAIGTLALCYNNTEFFKREVKMRIGLKAKIHDQTRTMADVYGAFFDFSSALKSKVDEKDHSATTILSRIEAIQKICSESGTINKRKSYVI